MKNKHKLSVALASLLLLPLQIDAQSTLADFESGMTAGTKFVDTWEQSPFNTGDCSNEAMVVDNPYCDNFNPTSKVLYYVRPYYAGDRNGVEIKLATPLQLTTETQYVHVFVHKPVSSRLLLRGLDTEHDTFQFQALSTSESRAGAWSDAVFAVKGGNYTIDRLVLYPDLDSSVGRLSSDIDIYIDEIIVNSSSESRSVSSYCNVGGDVTGGRYLSSIVTSGASGDVAIEYDGRETVYVTHETSSIVVVPGAEFTLEFTQKDASGNNEPWVADVFADFNEDMEFVSDGEYLGRVTGVASGDEVVYTATVTVPEDAPVSSGMLRIKLTDASDEAVADDAYASCGDVVDGFAVDVPLQVLEYSDRPIVKITGRSEQADWGSIRFVGMDGTQVMVNAGTTLTVMATPNAGYQFSGWFSQETGSLLSAEALYEFEPDYNVTLVAVFESVPYCTPESEMPVKYYFGQLSITPDSQSPLYYVGDEDTPVDEISSNVQRLSILGGVNVKRGTTFTLDGTKAVSSASLATANVGLWADWDSDHEFSEDEFVGEYDITSDTHQFSVSVPADAVNGEIYLRLIMTDADLSASASCGDVGNGSVYDLMVNVAPGDDERFSIDVQPSIPGAATVRFSPEPGEDGKFAAGTNVDITCVPADGYQFVQWLKDGMPYGATMTSNNPYPLTGLAEDLELTMKVEAKFPDYCDGSTPNNSDGDHYGITSGSLSVNGIPAFTFEKVASISDLSETCIAEVCPGDVIQLYVSGGEHSQWSQGIAYVDWNMDGEWDTVTEAYELFNNPVGTPVNNLLTEITVPDDVAIGCFGMRLCSGEAPAHNNMGGGPCQARRRGTLFTFRINSSVPPTSNPVLFVSQDEGCEVTITDQQGQPVENGDNVTPGETLGITVAMTDEVFLFDNVTVNGLVVEMEETETDVYAGEFEVPANGARVIVSTREMGYCEPTETLTRADRPASLGNDNRYLTEVSISGATYDGEPQSISITGLSQDPHRCVYENHTDQVLNCSPGNVLTPVLRFNASWMHKYVFVDWDRSYSFDVGNAEDGWDELVSFNYVDGVNSAGDAAGNDGSASLGTFTVPSDASGEYRIRFKLDWDSTDPCGRFDSGNSILDNGGGIVDFTLNVDAGVGVETASAATSYAVGGNGVIHLVTDGDATVDIIDAGTGIIVNNAVTVHDNADVNVAAGIYIVRMSTDDNVEVVKVSVK